LLDHCPQSKIEDVAPNRRLGVISPAFG
jgi:hypothetical protein